MGRDEVSLPGKNGDGTLGFEYGELNVFGSGVSMLAQNGLQVGRGQTAAAEASGIAPPGADQYLRWWIDDRSEGMKRNPANKAWVINRAIKAAVALSQEVSLAVAARPTIAPAATAAIQSKGANSARVRRSVKRNSTAAVTNSAAVLITPSSAEGRSPMRACRSRSTRSMHSVDGPVDGSHLDLHPDVRPDQRRNHGQPEHRLVRDDFRSHPRIRSYRYGAPRQSESTRTHH
jgi:hypothetical protein